MKCPIHGREKVMKIIDDESIKESYPVYSCAECAKELMAEIREFQKKVSGHFDPQEIAFRRAS